MTFRRDPRTNVLLNQPPNTISVAASTEVTSEEQLSFVQQCQVAVLDGTNADAVCRAVRMWSCLSAFPTQKDELTTALAVAAVCHVSQWFYCHSDNSVARPHANCTDRRRRANAVLERARQGFFRRDLRLSHIAVEFGVSREYLSRLLAIETSLSFQSAFRTHVNGLRLLAAIDHLHYNANSISVIAGLVGYRGNAEMDRQFRRWFGLSPTQFRRFMRRVPATLYQRI
jgi:AraC-like DNA-binding protein